MGLKETKPLSPEDIMDNIEDIIPEKVIRAVNNLLKLKFRGSSVRIKQDEIIAEVNSLGGPSRQSLIKNKYLDFEEVFRKNGWSVTYDKPSYGDSNFDAYFEFKPKK